MVKIEIQQIRIFSEKMKSDAESEYQTFVRKIKNIELINEKIKAFE